MITAYVAVRQERLLDFELMLKFSLEIGDDRSLCLNEFFLLYLIVGIVAFVFCYVSAVKFDHAVCNAVDEMSVVSDDEYRTAV